MCKRKTTTNIKKRQADQEAECDFARPDPPAEQTESRDESHQRDQGVDSPVEVLLFAVHGRGGLEGRHRTTCSEALPVLSGRRSCDWAQHAAQQPDGPGRRRDRERPARVED